MTKAQLKKIKELLPLIKAIRLRCLDCSAGSGYEVKVCPCDSCALYPFRMGLNSQEGKFTRGKTLETAKNVSGGEFEDGED